MKRLNDSSKTPIQILETRKELLLQLQAVLKDASELKKIAKELEETEIMLKKLRKSKDKTPLPKSKDKTPIPKSKNKTPIPKNK